MRVTVTLLDEKSDAGMEATDLLQLIRSCGEYKVVRRVGPKSRVSIDVTPAELQVLRNRIGDKVIFSPRVELEPFGDGR